MEIALAWALRSFEVSDAIFAAASCDRRQSANQRVQAGTSVTLLFGNIGDTYPATSVTRGPTTVDSRGPLPLRRVGSEVPESTAAVTVRAESRRCEDRLRCRPEIGQTVRRADSKPGDRVPSREVRSCLPDSAVEREGAADAFVFEVAMVLRVEDAQRKLGEVNAPAAVRQGLESK